MSAHSEFPSPLPDVHRERLDALIETSAHNLVALIDGGGLYHAYLQAHEGLEPSLSTAIRTTANSYQNVDSKDTNSLDDINMAIETGLTLGAWFAYDALASNDLQPTYNKIAQNDLQALETVSPAARLRMVASTGEGFVRTLSNWPHVPLRLFEYDTSLASYDLRDIASETYATCLGYMGVEAISLLTGRAIRNSQGLNWQLNTELKTQLAELQALDVLTTADF